MQINGKNVLTLEQFGQVYDQRHPERKPVEKRVSFTRFSIFGLEMSRKALALWFIVLAASIMSVGHIVPAMRSFYKLDLPVLVEIMGFAGFVTMSFAVITFMSRPERGWWAWMVIVMSVTTEMALNVFASLVAASEAVEVIRIGQVNVTQITAVILGLLPAIINMATGETVRQDMALERAEQEQVAAANAAAQGKYQTVLEQNYVKYLKRQGVADETKILEVLSGIYEDDYEPIRIDKTERPQLPPPEPFREPKAASPRALELAEKLKLDGNVKLTNGEIKQVYGITSPNIMSQARALLRMEGALA